MPVRRYFYHRLGGYGVFGSQLPDYTTDVLLDLNAEAQSIPLPPLNHWFPPEAYVVYTITLVWRFSVQVLLWNEEIIRQYHNPSAKTQFGRYVCRAKNYATDEGFISYADMKSRRYSCTFLATPDAWEPSEPCDEPQDDFNPYPVIDGNFTPYCGRPTFAGIGGQAPMFDFGAEMADSVELYFETGIYTARVGVSYMFAIDGMTEDMVATSGSVVPILL